MTSLTIPENILNRLTQATGCRAILLAGSHGRGEGDTAVAGMQPNDVDLVLVLDRPLTLWQRLQLHGLKQTLPVRLGVWHVDIMPVTKDALQASAVRMLIFDLKFGSTVLAGDKTIRDLIPHTFSSPIPATEIENLLINRLVTLAEGEPGGRMSMKERLRAARQICKCLYAVIDACLVEHQCYRTSYAEKRTQISALAPADGTAAAITNLLPWMTRAWSYQLEERELLPATLLARWHEVRALHLQALLRTRGAVDQRSYTSLSEVTASWRGTFRDPPWTTQRFLGTLLRRPTKRSVEIRLALWADRALGKTEEERMLRDALIADWYRAG